jgi:hypothetical protein
MATLDAEDKLWIHNKLVEIGRSPEFQLNKSAREPGQVAALLDTSIPLSLVGAGQESVTVRELLAVVRRLDKQYRTDNGHQPV